MKEEVVSPPCDSCKAHDALEEKIEGMGDKNTEDHSGILLRLDVLSNNIKWMNFIGKWVLGTMLGYYVVIAVYIMTCDFADSSEVQRIQDSIKDGEALHYKNEKHIDHIETILENMQLRVKDESRK